jgi:hypothetical protein
LTFNFSYAIKIFVGMRGQLSCQYGTMQKLKQQIQVKINKFPGDNHERF